VSLSPRAPIIAAGLLALALFIGVMLAFALAGRAFGREPDPPWVCDDTRFTQLVPVGRAVVGPPAAPPPGCATNHER
jgi:hypothetical protein